jgi:hypothetical protein
MRPPEYLQYDKVTKYMTFKLLEKKPRTTVWVITNNHSGVVLGLVEWYASWRQYVFVPREPSCFNNDCLKAIEDFLTNLNKQQTKQLAEAQYEL